MSFVLDLDVLVEYTAWQRQKWFAWLSEHGDDVLKTHAGPHGDGRFQTIGEIIRHIFSAEKRYIDRLSGRPITDTSLVAADRVDSLQELSQTSRRDLLDFLASHPAEKWDVPEEYTILDQPLMLSPKKIIVHVLLHEIRHWAQIATMLRFQGLTGEFQDLLFSPVLSVTSKV